MPLTQVSFSRMPCAGGRETGSESCPALQPQWQTVGAHFEGSLAELEPAQGFANRPDQQGRPDHREPERDKAGWLLQEFLRSNEKQDRRRGQAPQDGEDPRTFQFRPGLTVCASLSLILAPQPGLPGMRGLPLFGLVSACVGQGSPEREGKADEAEHQAEGDQSSRLRRAGIHDLADSLPRRQRADGAKRQGE